MSSHLLAGPSGHIIVLVTALAIAAAAKALASVLRTWIEQASRTRRLARSLEGTKPHQRPRIIEACGQLEERSIRRPDGDGAGGSVPAGDISSRQR